MRMRLAVSGVVLATGVFGCDSTQDLSAADQHKSGYAHKTLGIQCFNGLGSNGQPIPLGKIIHELRATDLGDQIDVAIIFNREFVDNTYGSTAIAWGRRGHTFRDLYKSDHVELGLSNASGEESFRAKIDYLSESVAIPSGFASLGVSGGDGRMISGSASDVVSFGTSMDDNFNRYGRILKESSPATDESYTPNLEIPDWNFWVEYRVAVKSVAFGTSGFKSAKMEFVHASPSKFEGTNTVEVEEGDCPDEGGSDPFPECVRTNPENDCYDPSAGGGSGGGEPDPGTGGTGGSVDSGGDGSAAPAPTGARCSSSADCAGGSSCSESGTCISL